MHTRVLAVICLSLAACGPSGTFSDAAVGDDDDDTPDARPLECTVGETRDCYTGADGTEGVGTCHGGTQECGNPGYWGPCNGEVRPGAEICPNGEDENCNGVADDDTDDDGDGFTTCGGDCCDSAGAVCNNPELVSPGAFEVPGNTVDDDCDNNVDESTAATCDTGLTANSGNAMDYARAIDLCQTTTASDTTWGVISAELHLSSGAGTPAASSRSIRPAFGGAMRRFGDAMAEFSTGTAAAKTDTAAPAHMPFQIGVPMGTTAALPNDWLTANGGSLPKHPDCPDPADDQGIDSVMLVLTVRAPTNARSFSLDANFFSAEYPEWVCSPFNDFFVVLLDSAYDGDPANPADKNLAVYTAPDMTQYPVGVNLAYGDTGLFRQCKDGPTGCCAVAVAGNTTTCDSTAELVGTGYDEQNPPKIPGPGVSGWCGTSNWAGGGTGWLTVSGNVVGGETITLRIAIWDTSDGYYDSVVLLDNFRWSVDASDPGTVIVE